MKVTTDSCFFGAWAADQIQHAAFKIERLLDIGTGTGLLSLMVAQKNYVDIDAVEIDPEAAQQAMGNIRSSPWHEKIKVYNQNILNFRSRQKYDCIICNPPFYENELNAADQRKNMAHHSSEISVKQVLGEIKRNLEEHGLFFLMYPAKREKEIDSLLDENNFHVRKKVLLKQSVDHAVFRIIVMAMNQKNEQTESSEISIWNESRQYTKEFIDLLKSYYLYL